MEITIKEIQPLVLSARILSQITEQEAEPTLCRTHRLLLANTGEFEARCDGDVFSLGHNNVFYCVPNRVYSFVPLSPECQCIDLRFRLLAGSSRKAIPIFTDYDLLNRPGTLLATPQTRRIFGRVIRDWQKKQLFSEEISSLHLHTILLSLLRDTVSPEQISVSDAATKIMRYVERHIHENITNESAAQELSYHPNYINRAIREATGMTFHRYVIREKLSLSLDYLLNTRYSITEISFLLAFNSSSHYSSLFAGFYHVTPSEFRKKYT